VLPFSFASHFVVLPVCLAAAIVMGNRAPALVTINADLATDFFQVGPNTRVVTAHVAMPWAERARAV